MLSGGAVSRLSLSLPLGPVGRLGRWTATHFKVVGVAWMVVAIGLGVFAPRVENALSGAGWEATGSESVKARDVVDREFGGLSSSALMVVVHSDDKTVSDPAFQAVVAQAERTLQRRPRVTRVWRPGGAVDLPRRPHRGHAGRRRGELQRDGARRRRPQGPLPRLRAATACRFR